MKRKIGLAFLVLALVLGVLFFIHNTTEANALPPDVEQIFKKADKLTLISLEPSPGYKGAKAFHGYEMLGQITVDKEKEREKLIGAFFKGISENKGLVAGCFIPRHGLRASHNGKTVEVVICFQCMSMLVYMDGKQAKSILTTSSPQPTFNALLIEAKVPLPKQAD